MADVKISDLSDVSLTADLAVADILPIVDASLIGVDDDNATTSVTLDILKDFISNHIVRSGWEYVSDKALETTSINLSEDTWTVLTNDGTSSATSREFLPYGASRIWNVSDNKIYMDQLQTKDVIWFRITLGGKPSTNNTLVKMLINYYNKDEEGNVNFNFQKNFVDQYMEDGAGVEHVKEFTVPFYIGSESTIRGYGELEVNCNTETEITDVAMLSVVN